MFIQVLCKLYIIGQGILFWIDLYLYNGLLSTIIMGSILVIKGYNTTIIICSILIIMGSIVVLQCASWCAMGWMHYKNMDNNQTWQAQTGSEQMQNWKKKLLLDPTLNSLLDQSLSPQQFLQTKISPLPKSQIPLLFTKLTTINHQLLQNIQKQVQQKTPLIQSSFTQLLSYKQQLQNQDNRQHSSPSSYTNKNTQYLSHLKLFNSKYETVEGCLVEWSNIREFLKYAKGLESFRVNVNIMKTLMRGFNGNQDSINCIKIAKMLKEVIGVSLMYDFGGIKSFEAQRVFVSSTKSIVYSKGCKVLPVFLQQYANLSSSQPQTPQKQPLQKNIQDWLHALSNINMLKDFVVSFGKYMLNQQLQHIKKSMKNDFVHIETNIQRILVPFLYESCKSLIFLQEKLVALRKVELSNVPNLFVRYWEKLCENVKENIGYAKKEQDRLKNKGREDEFVWKYPGFYQAFGKLCQDVQVYLLQTVLYNSYGFAKCKEKLMVNCLIQLSLQYHIEVQKQLSLLPTFLQTQSLPQSSQPHPQLSQQSPILLPTKKWLQSIQHIIKTSKNKQILTQILHSLYKKLKIVNQQIQPENYKEDQQQIRKQHVYISNYAKKQIKKLVVQYGKDVGIDRGSLEVFKVGK